MSYDGSDNIHVIEFYSVAYKNFKCCAEIGETIDDVSKYFCCFYNELYSCVPIKHVHAYGGSYIFKTNL